MKIGDKVKIVRNTIFPAINTECKDPAIGKEGIVSSVDNYSVIFVDEFKKGYFAYNSEIVKIS